MANDKSAQEPAAGTHVDAPARAVAGTQSPLAAALRAVDRSVARTIDPNDPSAQPEGSELARQQRMRDDLETRKAALLISSLMRTPDCALDVFRDGRAADAELDVRHLRRARDILDALYAAIRSEDPKRWEQVLAAWQALGLDRGEDTSDEMGPPEPDEGSAEDEADAPDTVASPPPERPAPPTAAPFSRAPSRPAMGASPWASRPPLSPSPQPPLSSQPTGQAASSLAPSPSAPPLPSPEQARASASRSEQAASSLAPSPTAPSAHSPRPAAEPPGADPPSQQPLESLDRTAEAPWARGEGTSLPDLGAKDRPVLPFRPAAQPGPSPNSTGEAAQGADVPMEEDHDAPEAATQRIRLHVLPFRAKAVPFEVKQSAPSSKAEAAPKPDPSLLPRALPFDGRSKSPEPTREPSAKEPSTRASTEDPWPEEETTSLFALDPPTEEPTTTRHSDALLARTVEVARGRAPERPSPGAARAQGHPTAATRVTASRPSDDEGAQTVAKEERSARAPTEGARETRRPAEAAAPSRGPGPGAKGPPTGDPEAIRRGAPIPASTGHDEQSEATTSLLDIEGYAAYRAEIALHPNDLGRIRQRYSLHGAASYERLDAYWQERLSQDPKLRKQWESLCQHYAAWLRMKGQ